MSLRPSGLDAVPEDCLEVIISFLVDGGTMSHYHFVDDRSAAAPAFNMHHNDPSAFSYRAVLGPQILVAGIGTLSWRWYAALRRVLDPTLPVDVVPTIGSANHGLIEPSRSLCVVEASADVLGGGTHREFKENLLAQHFSAWNKWYAVSSFPISVTLDYRRCSTPISVVGYLFATANDCPERDPRSWDVVDDCGRVVHHVENAKSILEDYSRFKWHYFKLPTPISTTRVMFQFLNARTCANECQLSQICVVGFNGACAPLARTSHPESKIAENAKASGKKHWWKR